MYSKNGLMKGGKGKDGFNDGWMGGMDGKICGWMDRWMDSPLSDVILAIQFR